ncbi:MAG: hypothetical protein R2834_09210 [Rhodothermales bacterium]
MHALPKALLYAFMGWLIPFITSSAMYPLREQGHPLFETIMPLSMALCGVFFSLLYLGATEEAFAREGVILGILCFVVSFTIDLVLALFGPAPMSFFGFLTNEGMASLMYPVVIVGMGLLLELKMRERDQAEALAS